MDNEIEREISSSSTMWEGIALRICERHGISVSGVLTPSSESNPVFLVNREYAVKIYTQREGAQRAFAVESNVLSALASEEIFPAPRLLAAEEIDGFSYLVMTVVPGDPLCQVWSLVAPAERVGLAQRIGRLLRQLHQTQVPQMIEIEARRFFEPVLVF